MDDNEVVALPRPGSTVSDDPLLTVLRDGAHRMLTQMIEAEVEAFLASHAALRDEAGRRRVVRNGHGPERNLQTGIGPLPVRRPKVRDRGAGSEEPIRVTSKVLPLYLRRTKNVEELLPWLYLKGISTGPFDDALTALLGADAPGLSPTTLQRLTADWQAEHERWATRDLSARRYVYFWADGVYFRPRMDEERQCALVLIGADATGGKELLAIDDRLSRERPELEAGLGPPRGEERPRPRPRTRRGRRRLGLLEGPRPHRGARPGPRPAINAVGRGC